MGTPFNHWLAGLLGLPTELIVALWVVLIPLAFLLIISKGLDFAWFLKEAFLTYNRRGESLKAVPFGLVFLVIIIPIFILNIIVHLLLLLAGVSAANRFRKWWHQG